MTDVSKVVESHKATAQRIGRTATREIPRCGRWGLWAPLAASILGMVFMLMAGERPSARAVAADARTAAPSPVLRKRADGAWELRGSVVDERGAPAAGVSIAVRNLSFVAKNRSAADGTFAVNVPAAPAWNLSVLAKDASGERQAFYRPETAASDRDVRPLRLELKPARRIACTVTDKSSRPVASATVVAVSSFVEVAEEQTDAGGKALLRVPSGLPLHDVFAMKPDVGLDYVAYQWGNGPASNPHLLLPDDDTPLKFTLAGTRTVRVRLVDAKQRPMAGLRLDPWFFKLPKKGSDLNLSGMDVFCATTDASGVATFHTLPANNQGTIAFWLRSADYVASERLTFEPGDKTNEVTAVVEPMQRIRGRAKFSDGRSAAGAEVLIAGSGYQLDDFRNSVKCDAQGAFELRVPPNNYYAFVAKDGREVSPPQTRVVRDGIPIEPIELVLKPATRVHGRFTVGAGSRPRPGVSISLYQRNADSYDAIPLDHRLPFPYGHTKAISPLIVQTAVTDKDGRFEFFAGPGQYYIDAPGTRGPAPEFVIRGQDLYVVNLYADRLKDRRLAGRIVFKSDPRRGVAEAKVWGVPEEQDAGYLSAVTGPDGRFAAKRPMFPMLIYAQTEDRQMAGIVRIGPGDTDVLVPVDATASAHGRLFDETTGLPAANRRIDYGHRVTYTFKGFTGFTSNFGGSAKTNASGEFTVLHLVPGWRFELNPVTAFDHDGRPRQWNSIGSVTASTPERVELGEFSISDPYHPLTLDEQIAQLLHSEQSIEERLMAALRDARLTEQRVLIVATSAKSDVGRRFFAIDRGYTFGKEAWTARAPRNALAKYALLAVDTSADNSRPARALLERLKLPIPSKDDAALGILDADGRLIAATTGAQLSVEKKLDANRLATFLEKSAPPTPDADERLAQALVRARKEDRRVLAYGGGSSCERFLRLCRFLDEHKSLIDKDYIRVYLERRFTNGESAMRRARGKAFQGMLAVPVLDAGGAVQKVLFPAGELPWIAILGADGNRLAATDDAEGNSAFPVMAKEIAKFEAMLRATSRHLTESEIQSLIQALSVRRP